MADRRMFALMAPKGSRTPVDLWWVVVIAGAIAAIGFHWTTMELLVGSAIAAAVLLVGHFIVIWRRKRQREQLS